MQTQPYATTISCHSTSSPTHNKLCRAHLSKPKRTLDRQRHLSSIATDSPATTPHMSDNATTPEDGSPVFQAVFRPPKGPSSAPTAPSIMRHPSFKHFQRRPPSDTPLMVEDKTPPQTPPQLDLEAANSDYLTIEKRPISSATASHMSRLREGSILGQLEGFTGAKEPQSSPLKPAPRLNPSTQQPPPLTHSNSTLHIPDYTGHKRKPRATTLDVPGQTRSKVSPDGMISARDVGSKLIVVMVGLPARGKSYITNKLCRYLNWQQHKTRIFNVGNTRREAKESADLGNDHDASFFSPDNPESTAQREIWAMETLQQCLDYVLHGNGSVGILDATNTTRDRRKNVFEKIQLESKGQLKVLFLESVCTNRDIINSNIRLKLSGPDYKLMDPQVALEDFTGRLRNYEKAYQTVDDTEEADMQDFQYVKMIDVGRKVVCFNIQGFLAGQVVFFLFNFNLLERQIWITRHGESQDNVLGRIGGDSSLTPRGEKFSKALVRFMDYQRGEFDKRQFAKLKLEQDIAAEQLSKEEGDEVAAATKAVEQLAMQDTQVQTGFDVAGQSSGPSLTLTEPSEPSTPAEPESSRSAPIPATAAPPISPGSAPGLHSNFCVWTSMLKRTVETASVFDEEHYDVKEMRMLNELGAGICDGMTYAEIKERYPHEYANRMKDKIQYRYPGPGGESYLDVISRLRPIICELERMHDHALIIGHRVVSRVLLAYFMNLGRHAIGDLDIPLHTLYVLEPKPYGVDWAMYEYNEDKDWFYKVSKEELQGHVPMVR